MPTASQGLGSLPILCCARSAQIVAKLATFQQDYYRLMISRLYWSIRPVYLKINKGIFEELFSRPRQSHSNKWPCNADAKFSYYVLEKNLSHVNKCIYNVHIYEELFSKTWYPNMALTLQPRFLDWRLTRFGKESSSFQTPFRSDNCDGITIQVFIWFGQNSLEGDMSVLACLCLLSCCWCTLREATPCS